MTSTGMSDPGALPSHSIIERPFDERVREGATSLLLAGLAAFALIRFFVIRRKAAKGLVKA